MATKPQRAVSGRPTPALDTAAPLGANLEPLRSAHGRQLRAPKSLHIQEPVGAQEGPWPIPGTSPLVRPILSRRGTSTIDDAASILHHGPRATLGDHLIASSAKTARLEGSGPL